MLGEISEKNFILHEFIGQRTTIIDTPDKTYKNKSGTIVDETMKTFTLELLEDGKMKNIIVPKHKTVFRFTLPLEMMGNFVTTSEDSISDFESIRYLDIDGTFLTKRPEDRIKKLAKHSKNMNYNLNSNLNNKNRSDILAL